MGVGGWVGESGLTSLLDHTSHPYSPTHPPTHLHTKKQSGGHSNAYTDMEHTCYFFNCLPNALEGALDRFAQFFISPLFTESATAREMQAVDR